jgi:hypothetical protein
LIYEAGVDISEPSRVLCPRCVYRFLVPTRTLLSVFSFYRPMFLLFYCHPNQQYYRYDEPKLTKPCDSERNDFTYQTAHTVIAVITSNRTTIKPVLLNRLRFLSFLNSSAISFARVLIGLPVCLWLNNLLFVEPRYKKLLMFG